MEVDRGNDDGSPALLFVELISLRSGSPLFGAMRILSALPHSIFRHHDIQLRKRAVYVGLKFLALGLMGDLMTQEY